MLTWLFALNFLYEYWKTNVLFCYNYIHIRVKSVVFAVSMKLCDQSGLETLNPDFGFFPNIYFLDHYGFEMQFNRGL